MVTETITCPQTILSPEVYIARHVKTLFRRFHLNKDLMIGFLGDTGSGKSVSAGYIAMSDYGIGGMPVYSNMGIKLTINAMGYNVTYEAGLLERNKLLRMDKQYHHACNVIDEINIKFAEARRSGSNINLWYNDLNQQKRKFAMPIIYTVISEMYVDNRVRELTDVFIRCHDTALTPHGLMTKQQQGIAVQWTIYDMKGKLSGTPHDNKRGPLGKIIVNLKNAWGIIDTYQAQIKGQNKYTELDNENIEGALPEIDEDPEVVQAKDEWGWLEPIAHDILHDGRALIPVKEIYNRGSVLAHGISQNKFSRRLNEYFGIETKQAMLDGKMQRVYINEKEKMLV